METQREYLERLSKIAESTYLESRPRLLQTRFAQTCYTVLDDGLITLRIEFWQNGQERTWGVFLKLLRLRPWPPRRGPI